MPRDAAEQHSDTDTSDSSSQSEAEDDEDPHHGSEDITASHPTTGGLIEELGSEAQSASDGRPGES